jgi:hypothetical protein
MGFLKDRRVVALGGAGLALVAGLVIAWVLLSRSHAPTEAPPASQGGLVVVSGRDDDAKLDPQRPLRCFVGGQFVGELPLAVCAQRNGVATGALDVGLDQAGALAASNGINADITPLPPQATPQQSPKAAEIPPDQAGSAAAEAEGAGQSGACWRYGAGGWRKLPAPATLIACIQTLYAGRCPTGDDAFYGRWSDQTLRLMSGQVEISDDNRDFRSLIDPWPGCEGASQ